jgi:hypothetical protein
LESAPIAQSPNSTAWRFSFNPLIGRNKELRSRDFRSADLLPDELLPGCSWIADTVCSDNVQTAMTMLFYADTEVGVPPWMHLWGSGRNGVSTDSVQGVAEK